MLDRTLFPLDGRTVEKISKVILNTLFTHFVFVPLSSSVVQLRNFVAIAWQRKQRYSMKRLLTFDPIYLLHCALLSMLERDGINHRKPPFFPIDVSNRNISIQISSNFSLSRFFALWVKNCFVHYLTRLAHFCQKYARLISFFY